LIIKHQRQIEPGRIQPGRLWGGAISVIFGGQVS